MKKRIITAVALVVIGALVCLAAAASMRFDFGRLDLSKYETNTYAVEERFRSISIKATAERILFRPSEGAECRVVCFEAQSMKHEVGVSGGTLTVKCVDRRGFADRFGIHTRTPEITVFLPEGAYADLRIETDAGDAELPSDFSFDSIAITGDTADVTCRASAKNGLEIALTTGEVSLSAVTAGSIDVRATTGSIGAENVRCEGDVRIRVDTGRVVLQDVTCRSLTSEGTTGDIALNGVVAADTLSVRRDTGDVRFDASDAGSLFVRTGTGDVTGTLLSDKVFIAETHAGRAEVPKTITGGRCEISTDTGDIRMEVLQAASGH